MVFGLRISCACPVQNRPPHEYKDKKVEKDYQRDALLDEILNNLIDVPAVGTELIRRFDRDGLKPEFMKLMAQMGKNDWAKYGQSERTDRAQMVDKDLKVKDPAINADAPGGIDFNPAKINLNIQHGPNQSTVEFPLNNNSVDFDGLLPVIINVTPLTDLPLFLGLAEPVVGELSKSQ